MKNDIERRELKYYLGLRYPVTIHTDPDSGYVAEIEELPGCMTQAETLDEVFRAIEDARQLWINTAYDEGQDIPLPRDIEKYTGRFLVRIPRSLHRALARAAKREGVSLNQYVINLLAAGVHGDIMKDQVNAVLSKAQFIVGTPTMAVFGEKEEPRAYRELISLQQGQLVGKN